jgi:hypothetical protein
MNSIFHIAQRDEWQLARAAGKYWPRNPGGELSLESGNQKSEPLTRINIQENSFS